VDLFTPDFEMLAHAYGWHAERLLTADALPAALRDAAARGGPSLIEWRD
jgi:thiamine pyrophosphate-dependent acetolactate synthase large subunit-like protein